MTRTIFALVFGVLLWATPATSFAKTMIVDVPVLNMRRCPSTDCKIIKKLRNGQKVSVNYETGSWVNVDVDGENGYTIKRSLRESLGYLWYYFIAILVLLGVVGSIIESFINRCPECKRWGAMKVVDRRCVDEEPSSITKVTHTKIGNSTIEHEYVVPATLYTIKITKKCIHCGEITTDYKFERLEN